MAKGKRGSAPKGPKTLAVSIQPTRKPYAVHLTESAEKVYADLRDKSEAAEARGEPTNQHCTTFRMVDDAIRRIIPTDPGNRKYALHKPLNDVYRIAKGRMRIAWILAPDRRELLILFISVELRKDGDARDPYEILNGMARAGYLTQIMEDWRHALYTPPDAPIN